MHEFHRNLEYYMSTLDLNGYIYIGERGVINVSKDMMMHILLCIFLSVAKDINYSKRYVDLVGIHQGD